MFALVIADGIAGGRYGPEADARDGGVATRADPAAGESAWSSCLLCLLFCFLFSSLLCSGWEEGGRGVRLQRRPPPSYLEPPLPPSERLDANARSVIIIIWFRGVRRLTASGIVDESGRPADGKNRESISRDRSRCRVVTAFGLIGTLDIVPKNARESLGLLYFKVHRV